MFYNSGGRVGNQYYKLWNWIGSRASIFICQVPLYPFQACSPLGEKSLEWILYRVKQAKQPLYSTLYRNQTEPNKDLKSSNNKHIFMSPLPPCDVPQLRFCHCLKFHCLLCKTRHSPDRTLKGNFLQMTRKSTHLCKLISWWLVLRLPTKS